MSVVRTASVAAIEQVFIEQIEPGDWVVSKRKTGNGDPRLWRVHAKGFKWNQADGGLITLRSSAESGDGSGAVSAPPGTPIFRATLAPAPTYTEVREESEKDEGYRHPKCYANTRGGCSTKISGEHFVSHGLIKLYGFDDPDLKIRHDTGFGVRQFVSPKKFVANILCETHNNNLHTADDAALAFATFIRTIALRFANGAGEWGGPEEITISGDDFQAWVLKLILNHVAGKAFSHQKGEFVSPFPPEAVDVLLGRAMWPRTWGLWVAGDTSHDGLRFRPFDRWEDSTTDFWSCQPFIHNDGWVGGGIVNLNGIGFGLTVFNSNRDDPGAFNNPGNPLRGSIQRPEFMAWDLGGITKRVNFTWNDCWTHKTITYKLSKG